MKPVLTGYADAGISAYSFLMAAGAGLLLWRGTADAKALGLARRQILWVFLAAWIGGWFGARLFFVVEHRDLLPDPWWSWIASREFGGFSSYGGVITGAAAAIASSRWVGLPAALVLDAGAIGLCLFGICARVGCFLVGCCHGAPSNLPWGVVFPGGSPAAQRYGAGTAVHPTQLYEIGVLILIAAWLTWKPPARPGERFLLLVACYSWGRLLLDEARGDSLVASGILSPAQGISLVTATASLLLMFFARRYPWNASFPVSRK